MAWKARLAQEIAAAGDKVFAQIEYYDDGAPSTVLHTESFSFPPNWSNGDMQGAIQTRGQTARTAQARAAVLAAAFPQATTVINIP
jgi:hypothetical protein